MVSLTLGLLVSISRLITRPRGWFYDDFSMNSWTLFSLRRSIDTCKALKQVWYRLARPSYASPKAFVWQQVRIHLITQGRQACIPQALWLLLSNCSSLVIDSIIWKLDSTICMKRVAWLLCLEPSLFLSPFWLPLPTLRRLRLSLKTLGRFVRKSLQMKSRSLREPSSYSTWQRFARADGETQRFKHPSKVSINSKEASEYFASM